MSSRTEELAVAVSATMGTYTKSLIFNKGESSLIPNNSTTLLQKDWKIGETELKMQF